MPAELLPFDVEQYTKGRLSQTDPETVRALDAAKARARRYCGWHVSPVRTETIRLDGDGGHLLFLPSLKVVSINAVTVNGAVLHSDNVKQLASAPGVLARRGGYWPCGYDNVEVDLTHGLDQYEAGDWREAVLRMVDQAATMAGQAGAGPLKVKEVDDVRYEWSDLVEFTKLDSTALSQYRLLAL